MSLTTPHEANSDGADAVSVFARAAKLHGVDPATLSTQQFLDYCDAVEDAGRYVDALRLRWAGELVARSHPDEDDGVSSLAHELGFTTPAQALAKVAGCSEVEARRRVKDVRLLAKFPLLSEAVAGGTISRGHAETIVDRLAPTVGNADPEMLTAAEEALTRSSRTLQVDLVDEQAKAWAAALDPDGREPVDEDALRRRFFTIGREQDGLAKVSGLLPVEHAVTIRTVLEAYVNPRAKVSFTPTEEPELPEDRRTPGQKRADVLRDVFAHHARTAESPDLGGDHPTVWVSTTTRELEHAVGDTLFAGAAEPAGIGAAQRTADTGGIQEVVLTDEGAFLKLGRTRRGFTKTQRRVLVARDGDRCVIPGCRMPARLCEVHHIVPWNRGGETDVGNAVHLCWFHHHEIDTGPWRLRTRNGKPEIRWHLGRRGGDWTPVNPGAGARRRT